MFRGQYSHSIDKKGRVIVPQKLRDEFGGVGFILAKGFDHCLMGYTMEGWDKFEEALSKIPDSLGNEVRAAKRFFLSGSNEVELDKMGRITVPASLREYANLQDETEVVLAGVGDHIEIWDKDAYNKAIDLSNENLDEIAAHLAKLGFSF